MAYFDNRKNVDDYIKMAEGYDGKELIGILQEYLPKDSSVLELGMGPGVDLDILGHHYTVTGSDSSSVFIDLYKEKHPEADLMVLDAETIDTERRFNCVFSNKVLHHLTRDGLRLSFLRQREILTSGGIAMHSFWYGSKEEFHEGLRFVYYTEEEFMNIVSPGYESVMIKRYSEMEEDDSFFVLLRKA